MTKPSTSYRRTHANCLWQLVGSPFKVKSRIVLIPSLMRSRWDEEIARLRDLSATEVDGSMKLTRQKVKKWSMARWELLSSYLDGSRSLDYIFQSSHECSRSSAEHTKRFWFSLLPNYPTWEKEAINCNRRQDNWIEDLHVHLLTSSLECWTETEDD